MSRLEKVRKTWVVGQFEIYSYFLCFVLVVGWSPALSLPFVPIIELQREQHLESPPVAAHRWFCPRL